MKLIILLLLVIVILLSIVVFLQRRTQKKTQTQLSNLQARLNPHFISNSLNAIENLIQRDQKKAAAKYLIHFSRLSRQLFNNSFRPSSSLAEEIQVLKHFLALEQLRFGRQFTYDLQISSKLNPKLISVPAMILQSKVENAIWKGFKPNNCSGHLLIHITQKGQKLLCTIEDHYPEGIRESRQEPTRTVMPQERLHPPDGFKNTKITNVDLIGPTGRPIGSRVCIELPLKKIDKSCRL